MISKTLMAASTRPIILAILSRGEDYGYNIILKVKDISGGHLEWTYGMLYPVKRLRVGLVWANWCDLVIIDPPVFTVVLSFQPVRG